MRTEQLRPAVRRAWGNSLYRNSFLILSTQAITSAVGYFFWAITARHSGPSTTGLTGSLVSAAAAATLLTTTGITVGSIPLLTKARSSGERQALAVAAGTASVLLSLVGGLVMVLVVPNFVRSLAPAGQTDLAVPLVILVLATSLGQLIDAVALATSNTRIMLWRGGIASGARLLVFALPGPTSLQDLIWSYSLATVVADLAALTLLRPRGLLAHVRHSGAATWRRRRYYLGNHVTSLGGAGAVYLLPVVVLSQLGPEKAGFFYPTWLLGGLFFTISPAVSNAYLARTGSAGEALGKQMREAVVVILVLLAVPLTFVLVAPGLVLSLFGPGYAERGSVLLRLLALSALPDAITNIAVAALRVVGRLRAAAALNMTMSVVVLASAFPLLAHFDVAGAGVAWLAAQSTGALAVPFLIRHRMWSGDS